MFKKSLVTLLLVGFVLANIGTFFGSTAHAAAPDCGSGSAHLAANPELKVLCTNFVTTEPETESGYLAANPELSVAARYAASAAIAQTQRLAANPELMVAQRFATQIDWSNGQLATR
jgi:hypothetical protein